MIKALFVSSLLLLGGITTQISGQPPRWENGSWCTGSAGISSISHSTLSCISAAQVSAMEAQKSTAELQRVAQSASAQASTLTQIKDQIAANTKAMQDLQAEIKRQNDTYNVDLQKLILGRFQNLPAELLNNKVFKDEITALMNQIIEDVRRSNEARGNQ